MSETNCYKELLYTPRQVQSRIEEIAAQLVEQYRGKQVLFVQLPNGSQPFAAKLMFAIVSIDPAFHPKLESLRISAYGDNREAGEPKILVDLPEKRRDLSKFDAVILVDDLIDDGYTTEAARRHLINYGARDVRVVVLARKRKDTKVVVEDALIGFETPDVWITGMGMDDARLAEEGNRWFEGIAIAND